MPPLHPMALLLLAELIPGFSTSQHFDEQTLQLDRDDVRIVINAPSPDTFDPQKPTELVLYLLPNGNTIEQTVGAQRAPGLDWHFDIQHIGAQTRLLRSVDPARNHVVAYLEAQGRSWPAWRKAREDNPRIIRQLVDAVARSVPGNPVTISLVAHSGGGSFIWGYLNGGDTIPDSVTRIVLLDANYSYSDEDHHGSKFLMWLRADASHRLIVMAYDDRDVELDGKKIVSETGGTYRASHRMIDRFSRDVTFAPSQQSGFDAFSAMNGQIVFLIHPNPQRKILHTTMVGEWNGFIHAMTLATPAQEKWGKFAGERAYNRFIQPPPATAPATRRSGSIPARPNNAIAGHAFMTKIAPLAPADREKAIVREITSGNIPGFLRNFSMIKVKATGIDGVQRTAEYRIMPDYLAVGSDDDFVRVPMTPMSAQAIADAFGCTLSTTKIADDAYAQASVKLEPRPLTERREAVETFVQHNDIIEQQRAGKALGALVAGIKKDVVITNRLKEKTNRVAIYGWHKLDGKPIQPLTIVHKKAYLDYSHGIRLVLDEMMVAGKPMTVQDVLRDPHLCNLISDEGRIDTARYDD